MGLLRDIVEALAFPFSIPRRLRDRRQTKLDIAKLEADAKARDARIRQPSPEEIKRFDPKVARLLKDLDELKGSRIDDSERKRRERAIRKRVKAAVRYIQGAGGRVYVFPWGGPLTIYYPASGGRNGRIEHRAMLLDHLFRQDPFVETVLRDLGCVGPN